MRLGCKSLVVLPLPPSGIPPSTLRQLVVSTRHRGFTKT